MSRQQRNDLFHFAVGMAREFPKAEHLARHLGELCNLAGAIHRLAETACNRELTQREKMADERAERRIREVCAEIDKRLKVTTSGDPRGCVVMLVVPSGWTNDFCNEGVCVPQ
jgi:hypothetical protein